METFTTQQEVLLMIGTSFSTKQLIERDNSFETEQMDEVEKLEEACANGMLEETLPEICGPSTKQKKIFLWGISEGESFIHLDFGETPEKNESYYSIDPYFFITTKLAN